MTVDTKKQDAAQPTDPLAILEAGQAFNWKDCWYPVAFLQDLPKDCPYGFSLYDEPLVLFRNPDGELACLIDRCPHRAAKLSDGQLIDGKIECLYHGWQFGSEGQCLHIPQLPVDAKIPVNACVQSFKVVERQGIIWIWAGGAEAANKDHIPTVADLDNPTVVSSDYMLDLPYDQTYFIENAIDPSHLFISHDGTLGSRKNAQPLAMEVLESSILGIRGKYQRTRQPNENWVNLNFVAPNLITYRSLAQGKSERVSGAALYSLPLGKGRCRIIIRNYRNFLTRKLRLQPRWMEHWYRSRFLEEDLPLVVGQQAEVERLGQNLKDVYLPLKTSDLLVIEYRKWLDKFGSSLPHYQGYSTSKNVGSNECNQQSVKLDRFSQHTLICGSCNRAYQVTRRLKQTLVAIAMGIAALAIITDGFWNQIGAVSASLLAVALAVVAQKVKTKFERSYTRH